MTSEGKKQAKYEMRLAKKRQKEEAARLLQEEQLRQDECFMKEALKLARKAALLGEVPIGCVIVYDGRIIARGYNRRVTDNSTLAHAELIAIKKASKVLKDWRLEQCTIYITLEPCQMCSGAIVQARIPRCVIGCMNPKAGCAGSVLNLLQIKEFNHQVSVSKGILESECSSLLTNFFANMRKRRNGIDKC